MQTMPQPGTELVNASNLYTAAPGVCLRYSRMPTQSQAGETMRLFFHKLRSIINRRRKEDDLRDELQFHLDEDAEERQWEAREEG